MRMFWALYALVCALLHHLLSHHYADVCRPRWWPLGTDVTPYCAIVHQALHALQASPLLALAPALPALPAAILRAQ